PEPELEKAFFHARKWDVLVTFDDLIKRARPYWYKESRASKHRKISDTATKTIGHEPGSIGPFPLIYADPPWQFETDSWAGLGSDGYRSNRSSFTGSSRSGRLFL